MIHRPFKDDSAFKAAVEARLRSHALERGISLQHIRQLLVFDRLLVRLQDAFGVPRCAQNDPRHAVDNAGYAASSSESSRLSALEGSL